MRRTYGNERTHLNLTEKAQKVYSNTDPLSIIEYEHEENGKIKYDYSMFGVFEDHYMSEAEVNEFLESLADDIDE